VSPDALEFFATGLVSSGLAASTVVFLFKAAFERKLEKEVARFQLGLDAELEAKKSAHRVGESERDANFNALLDFRAGQLRDFYWPLYVGLQKDNVVWRRILDKRDSDNELKRSVGAIIEKEVVLPNHACLVSVIEKNLYLAEADPELEALLLRYVRHVAVYSAIRSSGEEMRFPIKEGEEWPHELFPVVESRLRSLQDDYNRLLSIQASEGERAA
jgi:hypothetical protein